MPLPRPVSQNARQTIRVAFEDLERTITPSDAQGFGDTTLNNVVKYAWELEEQLAARGALRNMRRLMPLFNGLEHYGKVVDVLCNGTPYLSWIWAPIALILRIASEYVEAFEQIIRGYSRIAECLGRFKLLQGAFAGNSEFQQTLAVYYADIIQFHKHAYKFVRRSGWRLLFSTSWGRFQRRFDNILEDMKRHESLIDLNANAQSITTVAQIQQDISIWREESKERLDRMEKEHASKQYHSVLSWLKATDSDQISIYESMLSTGERYPGTCSWALKNSKLSQWLQMKAGSPVIWLVGNPGTGKSVLVAGLLAFMKTAGMPTIYHFCDPSYASSVEYDQILKSILLQLLRADQEQLAYVYDEFVVGRKLPVNQTLEIIIRTILSNLSHEPRQKHFIWIVLDGFEACSTEKQASLATLLNQNSSDSSNGTRCKILVASRTSMLLQTRLRRKQTISLTDEKASLEAAIKMYASQRLLSLRTKLRGLRFEANDATEIEETITQKADGMFLYARLVFDYIEHNLFSTCDEIKMSVRQLPKTISDFYRGILTQMLVRFDARSADRVRCLFGWIAFSKRPMKRTELLSAITFSSGDVDVTHIFPQYILDACSALIENRRGHTVAFIHNSVKEFLQSSDSSLVISENQALQDHGLASVTCLISALKNLQQPSAPLQVVEGLYAFLLYASQNWTDYVLDVACDIESNDRDSTLLTLAGQLAEMLNDGHSDQITDCNHKSHDTRISSLSSRPILQQQICLALADRTLSSLERRLQESNKITKKGPLAVYSSGISTLVKSYQKTVRFLLDQQSYPGVTFEEFEIFKQESRASAFSCSLDSCPRATVGFETEKLLHEHERIHARLYRCGVENCQFPPFTTSKALNSHRHKHHAVQPTRSIRRVGQMTTTTAAPTPTYAYDPSARPGTQGQQQPSTQPAQQQTQPQQQQPQQQTLPQHQQAQAQAQAQAPTINRPPSAQQTVPGQIPTQGAPSAQQQQAANANTRGAVAENLSQMQKPKIPDHQPPLHMAEQSIDEDYLEEYYLEEDYLREDYLREDNLKEDYLGKDYIDWTSEWDAL